jgi:hypothetical protein
MTAASGYLRGGDAARRKFRAQCPHADRRTDEDTLKD